MKAWRVAVGLGALMLAPSAMRGCAVSIDSTDQMSFSSREIKVAADCTAVDLTLRHTGKLAVTAMGHNWVLTRSADYQPVAMAGMRMTLADSYLPKADKRAGAHQGDRRRTTRVRFYPGPAERWRLHLLLFVPRPLRDDEGQVPLRLEKKGTEGLSRLCTRLNPSALVALNATRAAARVASITASSCALDRKPASYADGARNTPWSSIAWKKRLNAGMSEQWPAHGLHLLAGEEQPEHRAHAGGDHGHAGFGGGRFQATQARGALGQVGVEARLLDQFQHRQAGGHRHRVAAQRTCLVDRAGRGDLLHQLAAAAVGPDRHAAANDLAEGGQVGVMP